MESPKKKAVNREKGKRCRVGPTERAPPFPQIPLASPRTGKGRANNRSIGPDGRNDQTAAGPNAEPAKDKTSQQCDEHADDNVAHNAEPTAFNHVSRKPTGNQADEDEPQDVHDVVLYLNWGVRSNYV